MQQRLGHKLLNISTDTCISSNMVSHVTLLSLIHFEHVTSLRPIGLSFLPAREKGIPNALFWNSPLEQRLLSETDVSMCTETPAKVKF